MSNLLFGIENFLDSSYYDVVIHSTGDWSGDLPLSNLAVDDLSQAAQSATATTADTQFEADLGVTRNVGLIAFPSHNESLSGTVQIDATNTPKFSDCTIGSVASIGDTSVVFTAGASAATITAGDVFTVNGYTYRSLTTTTITALGSDTITLDTVVGFGYSSLQTNLTVGMEITCNSGDYTTPLYDSGSVNGVPRIYDFGTLPLGHPSFWTGKPTEEERRQNVYPIVSIPTNTVLARFWRFRFTDTSNIMSCLRLSRLFLMNTYQPTVNAAYGASTGLQTDTARETSLGSIDTYDVREVRRVQGFVLENLSETEALTNALDLQRKLGINKQTFFVFNPEDTSHMHRRAYTCTLGNLNPMLYPYFDRMNAGFETREVLGGNMN